MGLLVRRAEPQDAPVVARVHTASWRQAYRGLLPQEYLDALSVEARTKTRAKAFSQLPGQARPTWSRNWTVRSPQSAGSPSVNSSQRHRPWGRLSCCAAGIGSVRLRFGCLTSTVLDAPCCLDDS